MKVKMKHKILSMFLAATLVTSAICSNFSFVSATDSPPMVGTQAFKPNQPGFNGYRIWDIRDWTPEEDPGAEFLRAEVPLQARIAPFKPTQANPTLKTEAEIMLMQGDYGNAFVDGMMYNNTFSYNTLNYWQYVDYFSPWHGAATATSPKDLYDWNLEETDPNGWQKRYFEFGVLNIPNPAYTNAAHKNGAKSIACIYFDQSFRQGQTINELFIQDEDGKFPVAEKLIEMAKYFKYDGYFFNAEEPVESRFADSKKKFLARLTEAGLWTQYYNTNSAMDKSKADWLEYDIDGDGNKEKIQDSVFVNYGWPGSLESPNANFDFINQYKKELKEKATTKEEKDKIDKFEFERVFYGVEAKKGKFNNNPEGGDDSTSGHDTARFISQLYTPGTKNLRASVALFTPSDYYQRDLPGNLNQKGSVLNDDAYQWMIAERERMYFSGVKSDPTNTGKFENFARPEVGVNDASGWVGVADFASERSVISGSNFYTNFNVGKGMQYFNNGKVSRDEQWSNITVQDILPSWQWWVTSKTENKLKVDFDYGTKYYTGATEFEKVGAYNGGSSLVVTGNLDSENLLRLYKTDLSVKDNSKVDITYFKSAKTDASEMKLALIIKDAPEKVEYVSVPNTGLKSSSWKTATIDLSKYTGKEIATIALAFNPRQGAIANYQMNIGEIKVYDNSISKPEKPTNFKVDRMFTDDEVIVTWDLASFDKVDKYEIFATLSNGEKINVGSNYDNIYYIKSLLNEKDAVKLELVAVGKDGSKSEPAVIDFDYKNKVSNVKVESVKKLVKTIPDTQVIGSVTQAKDLGILNISWTNPTTNYKELEITVSMDNSKDKTTFTKTVAKGINNTEVVVPRGHGEKYNVAIKTVLNNGTKTEAINSTGNVQDVYVAPYDANKVTINGTSATFWCPDPNDWFKIHATFNEKPLNFSSRFAGTQNNAIRATTYMKTNLPSSNGILSVVVEDYSGNFSEPTIIPVLSNPDALVDESMIPDEVLRNAVIEQAGKTIKEVNKFNGTLNLSGLSINDFKGVSLVSNAKVIDLSNSSIKNLTKDMLSGNAEKLILKDSKDLVKVDFDSLKALSKLKELDITGCENLQILNINDSSLEKLVYGNVENFKKIVSVNMSNAKFDLSKGTQERAFVDAIIEQTKNEKDIVTKSTEKKNLALGLTPLPESTTKSALELFDGEMNYFNLTSQFPSEVIVKFNSPQEIVGWKFLNDTYDGYGLADFEIQYSVDGTEWKTLGEPVVGNDKPEIEQEITNTVAAAHYKLIANKAMARSADVRELQLFGYEQVIYPAGVNFVNQRPNAYDDYPETYSVDLNKGILDVDKIKEVKTINGNDFTKLADADFIDKDYDLTNAMLGEELLIKLTDLKGNVTANKIDTARAETYKAEFISFKTNESTEKVVETCTIKVGDGGNSTGGGTGGSTGGGSGSVTPTEPTNPTSPTETIAIYDDATNIMAVIPGGIKNLSKPRLEVKKLANNSQEVAKLLKATKGYKLVLQYEIDLYDGETKVTQVEGGKIRVSIPYADIKANTTYVVLRLNDNGTVTELAATVKDGRIEFETDHFSTYAIAVKNTVAQKPVSPTTPQKPTKNPQTGDSNPMLPLAVLVTLLGATTVSGLVVRKKSKQN